MDEQPVRNGCGLPWSYSQAAIFFAGIVTACGFFLSCRREVAHALEIADDARHIVDVLAVAVGTLFEVALIDVSTVVTDRIRNVEREIVASFFGSHFQELAVLCL